MDNEIDLDLDKQAIALKERRMKWDNHKALLLPLVRDMQRLGATVTFPESLDFALTGDKHALVAAIRALRTRGFEHHSEPPQKGKSEWYAFFYKDGCDITVWFRFASTVCRRVKVGTKTVEQDVYETVCDELVLDEAAA